MKTTQSKTASPYQLKPFHLWLVLWAVIYTLIITLGITAPHSLVLTVIKLGGIFLCLMYAWLTFPDDHLLQIALLVTLIADVLLAINNVSEFGVLTFLVSQVVHLLRLNSPRIKGPLMIFVCLAALALVLTIMIDYTLVVVTTAGCYFILLLANVVSALRWYSRDYHSIQAWCGVTGFLLFLCCDLWVGVSFLALNHLIHPVFYILANFFAWFFYYPAQVLISNSSKLKAYQTKKLA